MIQPSDDLTLGGPVVPQRTDDCQRCDPCTNGPDSSADAVCPAVPQQPDVRECGCERLCGGLWGCELHRPIIGVSAADRCGAILVRALFAVAGRVAAGATPAAAVADVRDRFGI